MARAPSYTTSSSSGSANYYSNSAPSYTSSEDGFTPSIDDTQNVSQNLGYWISPTGNITYYHIDDFMYKLKTL